ncbi:MAG: hypothetical protein SOZ40_02960 [Ezakiella sp.]|nr:hypothetical protein [Ezakiella sp.]MDD7762029.1 hypothetical protein [Bacillota bacterium]MDY3946951.1 hypothetical protein [Ezakiella sp.]
MESMSKKNKIYLYIALAIVIALIVLVIYFIIQDRQKEALFDAKIEEDMASLADLFTYNYHYGSDGSLREIQSNADGSVSLKYSFGKIEVSKREIKPKDGNLLVIRSKSSVDVYLPSPEVVSHDLIIDKEEQNILKENKRINDIKIKVEKELYENGAIEEYESKFKSLLQIYFDALGFKEVKFHDYERASL